MFSKRQTKIFFYIIALISVSLVIWAAENKTYESCLHSFDVNNYDNKINKIYMNLKNSNLDLLNKDLNEIYWDIYRRKLTQKYDKLKSNAPSRIYIDESIIYFSAYDYDFRNNKKDIAVRGKLSLLKGEISAMKNRCVPWNL